MHPYCVERSDKIVSLQKIMETKHEISLSETLYTVSQLPPKSQQLVLGYLSTSPFRNEMRAVGEAAKRQHKPCSLEGYRSHLAGEFLEGVAIDYLRRNKRNNERLLRKNGISAFCNSGELRQAILNGMPFVPTDGIGLTPVGDVTLFSSVLEITSSDLGDERKIKQFEQYKEASPIKAIYLDRSNSWKRIFGEKVHQRFSGLPPQVVFDPEVYKIRYIVPLRHEVPFDAPNLEIMELPIVQNDLIAISEAMVADLRKS